MIATYSSDAHTQLGYNDDGLCDNHDQLSKLHHHAFPPGQLVILHGT